MDLSEEKKLAMLERLADMRETVKKNREAKKVVDPIIKEKEIDAIFEKKYGTKFDKMTELLTDLNENTKETLKIKKEKNIKAYPYSIEGNLFSKRIDIDKHFSKSLKDIKDKTKSLSNVRPDNKDNLEKIDLIDDLEPRKLKENEE